MNAAAPMSTRLSGRDTFRSAVQSRKQLSGSSANPSGMNTDSIRLFCVNAAPDTIEFLKPATRLPPHSDGTSTSVSSPR